MLSTRDYKNFIVTIPPSTEISFEGAAAANHALPGDTVEMENERVKSIVERAKHGPLVGILELSSKTRFGMTSRNALIYRFIPFNDAYPPFFVGCAQKDVSTNVIAYVEFSHWDSGTCPRGNLIRILGPCGIVAVEEEGILLNACATKWSKTDVEKLIPPHIVPGTYFTEATTFHVDPPGCKDIDDAISLIPSPIGGTVVKIHIADVAAWLIKNPELVIKASEIAQTYYLDGVAVKPMFPAVFSENLFSLIPGHERHTITLTAYWSPTSKSVYIDENCWSFEKIKVQESYTYDTFYGCKHAPLLADICSSLAGRPLTDSHEWIEQLMLKYNSEAAKLLKKNGVGILRRHSGKDEERYERLEKLGLPAHKLAMYAGEYCLSTEKNTSHLGISCPVYCHASSPIRRWVDCINQLALHSIYEGVNTFMPKSITTQISMSNIKSKQAKRYERDIRFMRALLSPSDPMKGIIAEIGVKIKIWVPEWDRLITARPLHECSLGDKVVITFYADPNRPSWKNRIIVNWKHDFHAPIHVTESLKNFTQPKRGSWNTFF
jgi:exoribonuclease R